MNTRPLNLTTVTAGDTDDLQRIAAENVLAPGYYWRLKRNLEVPIPNWKDRSWTLYAGDVHLLLDIFEFEGTPHTAILLGHPRNGSNSHYRILIADFLANLEPATDADSVRATEQAKIMQEVADMQSEMAQAQENPLALPGVQEAVEESLEEFTRKMEAEVAASQQDHVQRIADLRRIHRRAARRSSAAGNPLVARSVTISDQVGLMISGGIDSEGLQELTVEARKRIVIAETTSKWLIKRSEKLADKLKCLTPYYAEKGQVALARAKKAISYVKDITQGLTSLKLYTGDGVDVVTILEGAHAPASEPLTLVQGKRRMDEELAVWANVDDDFDWTHQGRFFEALKTNPSLVDQVFPASRCVVSMAVTGRDIYYSSRDTTPWQRVMNQIRNRAVFLLVRDGQNIHAVYSSEPSHEAAARLFPTQKEIEEPFRGIDGSTIGLQDVAFGESAERFDDIALHYKRFLILLCGLDHRMKLFGEFYPPETALQFMSLGFQQRYFSFLEDDNDERLIGDGMEPVSKWIERCNTAVRSGSRVITSLDGHLTAASPQLTRSRSEKLCQSRMTVQLVVAREKGHHYISVPTESRYGRGRGQASVWLDGPSSTESRDWFLCMDLVRLATVQRYIYSRLNRTRNISWLRAFKRAEAILLEEQQQQAALREVLARAALDNGVLAAGEVVEAIELALATWRAARRGSDAPAATDTKAVHELLTLMYPNDRIARSTDQWVARLIADLGAAPLMLCRTGKTRLVLYVEATPLDREPYADGVHWGWVKRVLIDVLKTKLSVASQSLVWLQKGKPNAAETVMREWPRLQDWIQEHAEPCPLRWLSEAKTTIAAHAAKLGPILAQGRSRPARAGIEEGFMSDLLRDAKSQFEPLKYYQHMHFTVPLGVTQQKVRAPVLFLYATCNAAQFVHRYGTKSQWDTYKKSVFCGHDRYSTRSLAEPFKWDLLETKEPVRRAVVRWVQVRSVDTKWNTVNSHYSGGVKRSERASSFHENSTRATRRANGGAPRHTRATLVLSWNRSIESLLGVAPHVRRLFYAQVNSRVNRVGFSLDDSYDEARKAERNRKFEPNPPRHHLSPLIWDAVSGRSNANRYFSTQN